MNLTDYKAVVLAGGRGARLYPVTKEIPKPLLTIKKKPIINYSVDLFQKAGIKDIAVLINKSQRDDFDWWKRRYYPDSFITFGEENEFQGTFGGLVILKDWIKNNSFFMANGDDLKNIDLIKMAEFHKSQNLIATIALVKNENPSSFGVVECKSGRVVNFLEKPENPLTNLINAGLYLFSPEIFNYHSGDKFLMVEKDIFPILAKQSKLAGFESDGTCFDCGTWERYGQAVEA